MLQNEKTKKLGIKNKRLSAGGTSPTSSQSPFRHLTYGAIALFLSPRRFGPLDIFQMRSNQTD